MMHGQPNIKLKSVFVVSSFSLRQFVQLSSLHTSLQLSRHNMICFVLQLHTVIFLRIITAYIPMDTLRITWFK